MSHSHPVLIGGEGISRCVGYRHRKAEDIDILSLGDPPLDESYISSFRSAGTKVDLISLPAESASWVANNRPLSVLELNLSALVFLFESSQNARSHEGLVVGSRIGLFVSKAVVIQMRRNVEREARDAFDLCVLSATLDPSDPRWCSLSPDLRSSIHSALERFFVDESATTWSRIRSFVLPCLGHADALRGMTSILTLAESLVR